MNVNINRADFLNPASSLHSLKKAHQDTIEQNLASIFQKILKPDPFALTPGQDEAPPPIAQKGLWYKIVQFLYRPFHLLRRQ